MIYTLTFNPAIDYNITVEDFSVGDICRTSSENFTVGGKGINVSVVLSRLGIENTTLGFAAGFTGAEIERTLQSEGLKTDFITLEKGFTRINVKLNAKEIQTEINGQGPDISESALQKLFEKLDKLRKCDMLILAGSVPKTLPSDIYEKIMERYNNIGIDFVVDAEKQLLVNSLKYRPFLVKPNHIELGDIFGKKLKSQEDIIQCALSLQNKGARNVLVSMGEKGALLLSEDGAVHQIGTVKGSTVNAVGAGDSMLAGFIAGYIQKHEYQYALELGTASGSATAFSSYLGTYEEIKSNLGIIQRQSFYKIIKNI